MITYVSALSANNLMVDYDHHSYIDLKVFAILHLLDHCVDNPCGEHGTCKNGADTFTCDCEPGYLPPLCQQGNYRILIT